MKNLLLKILSFGLYRPFTHDPKDFRFKISPSWFSIDYVQFEYSANGGKTWKSIKHASEPRYSGYKWTWETLTYKLSYDYDYRREKEKFNSYQAILDFEKSETKRGNDGNKEIEKEQRKIHNKKLKAYKSINK